MATVYNAATAAQLSTALTQAGTLPPDESVSINIVGDFLLGQQLPSGGRPISLNISRNLTVDSDSAGFAGSTTVTSGVLTIGNGGTTGSLGGAISLQRGSYTPEPELIFDRADTLILGTQITADPYSQTLKKGSGDLVLQGFNQFSGGITVEQGRLITQYSYGLSGTVALNTGTSFVLDTASGNIIHNGIVSGPGSLVKASAGTAKIVYAAVSGGVSVDAGTLVIGSAYQQPIFYGNVTIAAGAELVVDSIASSPATGQGASGAGKLTKTGTQAASFSSVDITGIVDAASGSLNVGSNAKFGELRVASGASVVTTGSVTVAASGKLTGAGAVTNTGTGGVVSLSDVSDFTGTVSSTANQVLADLSSNKSFIGHITSIAGVIELKGNAATIAGNQTASTVIVKDGSFVLTGKVTATALKIVNASLTIGDGGNLGSIAVSSIALDASHLTFNQSSDTLVAVSISSASVNDTLKKLGSGVLTLSGDNSAFVGKTTVEAGAINVTGSLGGVISASGGTVRGSGTIGAVDLGASAQITAGADGVAATLATGSLSLDVGAKLVFDVTGAGHDKLAVTGSVSLAGAALQLDVKDAASLKYGQAMVLIDNDGAEAVNGTFKGLNEGASIKSGNSEFKISYKGGTGNDVTLTLQAPPQPQPETSSPTPTIVTGEPGRNVFTDSPGPQKFIGGTSLDHVVFSLSRSAYKVEIGPNGLPTKITGPDGSDTLENIERINFADGSLAFDIAGNAGQSYRLYEAAFNRAPDAKGLGFWIKSRDDNTKDLLETAKNFLYSDEFTKTFGAVQTVKNDTLVDLFYRNILDRAPDDAGRSYWIQKLGEGLTREHFLAFFSESSENQAHLLPDYQAGIWYT